MRPLWVRGSAGKRKTYLNLTTLIVVAVLCVLAMLMAFPFVWMLSASLKTEITVFNLPPELWPYEWRWQNYLAVINNPWVPFPLLFLNSIRIAGAITIGQLFTCTLAAFAFARLRFPGRNFLFLLLLSAVMIPGQVTIVPLFILMRLLGLVDTHGALILPDLTNIFGIFLLRQFFLTIPDDLIDAARMDGASFFRILWQIVVPLSGPALATLAILTFIASWNNFFGPFIFINTWTKMTWPLGLVALNATAAVGGFDANVSVMMAGVTLAFLPAFVLFLFARRFFVESIAQSGLKL